MTQGHPLLSGFKMFIPDEIYVDGKCFYLYDVFVHREELNDEIKAVKDEFKTKYQVRIFKSFFLVQDRYALYFNNVIRNPFGITIVKSQGKLKKCFNSKKARWISESTI